MEKSVLRRQVDHTGMTMELEQYSKAEDKKSELLLFIKSLSYYYRLSLRLFVLDDSIEVRKAHKARTDVDNRRCVRARRVAASSVVADRTTRPSSSISGVNLGLARSE
jgi:hypothetical protein